MKVFIGADHNGFALKEELEKYLRDKGHEVIDKGDETLDKDDDFPMYAARVASDVLANNNSVGIVLCGSGQGVCIAANRFKGIRASLVWDRDEAHASRNDDDANVLCLPARKLNLQQAIDLVETWLETPYAGAARFNRRIQQLDQLT